MPEGEYTAEQVDQALEALTGEGRLDHARDVITHAAPALQQILDEALVEGGYLAAAAAQIEGAVGTPDPEQRLLDVRTLMAEETRLGMLIGASVGFQLARELARTDNDDPGA